MKKSVFKLDAAIDTWRSLLERRRVFMGDDLEELEGHLRDHINQLIREGHSEEDAFQQARAHLGDFTLLEKAYKHVFWSKLKHNKQLLGNFIYQFSMIKSYLKLAVRNLKKHKGYSAINISGLAVGLACSFFIFIWIQYQFSIDNFHAKGDRLFQVKIDDLGGDGVSRWSNVPMPLASTLTSTFPEVEQAVLTLPIRTALKQAGFSSREQGYFAGAGFFDIFSFPFIIGDPGQALKEPGSIVISERVAAKYFGPDWQAEQIILGKTLTLDYWQSDGGVLGKAAMVNSYKDFLITGVFKETPRHSSLQFDVVLPVAEVVQNFAHVQSWGPRWFELTLVLRNGVDEKTFGNKAKSILSDYVEGTENQDLVLQSFGNVYLQSANENGIKSAGRIQQVYIIGLIGLAILLIACVNFMNLVTARSGQRAREIGVRKALGATPSSLVQQFLGEAILTSVLALFFAVGLLVVCLPMFNSIAGTTIAISDLAMQSWFYFGLIALVTGIMAGSYPAFYLASQRVVGVFRSQMKMRRQGEVSLRKGLVIFQFGVSAFLIVGTLTVYQQLNYLQNKDLGLDKENVAMIRLEGAMHQQFEAVRETLLQDPGITGISRSSAHPIGVAIKNSNFYWEGKEIDENVLFTVLRTDDQFAETMKLNVLTGRFFDEQIDGASQRYVVNESAVKAMGLVNPVGHPFTFGRNEEGVSTGQIIGVVNDFHTGSLKEEEIAPLVFRYEPAGANVLLVRIAPGKTARALTALESVHARFNQDYSFEYAFLDEAYQAYYVEEEMLKKLSQVFAFIAIFIACMGLVGLSAFSVQQRTKEIGVRRVLGATRGHVVYVLTKEFIKPVVIALGLALPFAFWGMQRWLDTFAYRIDMGPDALVVAALFSMIITIVAVSYHALRAVRLNPVASLKQE